MISSARSTIPACSRDHLSHLKIVLFFHILNGRTDDICENSNSTCRDCGPAEWINYFLRYIISLPCLTQDKIVVVLNSFWNGFPNEFVCIKDCSESSTSSTFRISCAGRTLLTASLARCDTKCQNSRNQKHFHVVHMKVN